MFFFFVYFQGNRPSDFTAEICDVPGCSGAFDAAACPGKIRKTPLLTRWGCSSCAYEGDLGTNRRGHNNCVPGVGESLVVAQRDLLLVLFVRG